MPKRNDIQSVLIIGAGPIVIGQGCEFDYSGAQACQALKEEGYRVILVNSNPATIMTDPNLADSTYIEPINWQTVEQIIAKEKPDALLPTMGGQTALNCALDLAREGVLKRYNVELIGASQEAIDKAEDRDKFRQSMSKIGLKMPRSFIAHNIDEAKKAQEELGFPTIIRPSFTLGGSGGGIAYNHEEFEIICKRGLDLSPTNELLVEESILGWKEFEMEVVRDRKDNCIIVCAIENLDPMGIHTGDSITVAPAQTLTDKEYQSMRDASINVLREIGVETGGSNVQFAINPKNGDMVVIEMNPRVSRSSALASKATGFPIARVAAKLAIGYGLDELLNEMTNGQTPCSFEPTIDYVVTKIPRFNFEKFSSQDALLTTQMKSVGEVMAIGRCFQESFQKAIRGLEINQYGLEEKIKTNTSETMSVLRKELTRAGSERIWYVGDAFRLGLSLDEIYKLTSIDPWFLSQIEEIVKSEIQIKALSVGTLTYPLLLTFKRQGFSDRRIAQLLNVSETVVRDKRHELSIRPVYKHVDTCSAEFKVSTAYLYSTYETYCESKPTANKKIVVLGGGPNRIGQGIEFDYCCVHASLAMKEAGYETIMINCNPETVSTDFDVSDKLYFEPLTLEDVLEVVMNEKPIGVIVQYGGQTPLKLARALEQAGVPILGTSPDAIDKAEDRQRFAQVLHDLDLKQPPNGMATSLEDGLAIGAKIGYPLMVRPSYVLGGRAMEIVHDDQDLKGYLLNAFTATDEPAPVLLDRFLDDAVEVDVDAVCDGQHVVIGGIMEHIEQAGVHSGDSACSLPPFSLSLDIQNEIKKQVIKLAQSLDVIGLINVQFAVQNNEIFVLEVNPRAARTIPFVSKAIGISLAKVGALCMIGHSLASQKLTHEIVPDYFSVKKSVFPFVKFPHADPILGPEMRSTGEVMGIGEHFAEAFGKSDLATNQFVKSKGQVFISVKDSDKCKVVDIARDLINLGYTIGATRGTAGYLLAQNIECEHINKVVEGRPHIVDFIKNDKIVFIINTTEGRLAIADSFEIRRNAVQHKVSYETTVAGARAVVLAMKHKTKQVFKLQDLHKRVKNNDTVSNDA